MSALESVRRLFESAMMNARAVISAMKTRRKEELVKARVEGEEVEEECRCGDRHSLSHALQKRIGAKEAQTMRRVG